MTLPLNHLPYYYQAKVRLYLPHDFDESRTYPLLINVYAGPNSQQVSDRFKLDWGTYLTTSEGTIHILRKPNLGLF